MVCPPAGDEFERLPFLGNELVVVAPAGHALARAKAIPAARVARERFILREPGSGTRVELERFFHEQRVVPNVRMELIAMRRSSMPWRPAWRVGAVHTYACTWTRCSTTLSFSTWRASRSRVSGLSFFPAQRRLSVVAGRSATTFGRESARITRQSRREPGWVLGASTRERPEHGLPAVK